MKIALLMLAACLLSAELCASAPLRIVLTAQSHPAGLYHSGDHTKLNIRIINPGKIVHLLSGNLRWVRYGRDGNKAILLAQTPIRPTMLTQGQIVRIVLPETFAGVGRYRLLWHKAVIPALKSFQYPRCIYAPRWARGGGENSPWIAPLPRRFISPHAPGFIADYIKETGIKQFVYNIRLSTDRDNDFPKLISRVAGKLKQSGAKLIAVFTVSASSPGQNRHVLYHAMIENIDAISAVCRAVVLRFSGPANPHAATIVNTVIPRLHEALRALHCGAKLFATPEVIGAGQGNMALTSLISGVALSDTRQSLRLCHNLELSDAALPVMILPAAYTPADRVSNRVTPDPALFLVAAARYVPVPADLDNFELHVLGRGKLYCLVHPQLPLMAAVFTQTSGSCALVTGLGSGSFADTRFNAWRTTPPLMIKRSVWQVAIKDGTAGWERLRALMPTPGNFPTGKIIVVDAEGLMATRDARGHRAPVPYPGWQEIPLNQHVYFLTYPGTAADLAAAIRTAAIKNLPVAEFGLTANANTSSESTVSLLVRNARVGRLQGTLSLWAPKKSDKRIRVVQISPAIHFGPIHSGKTARVKLHLKHGYKAWSAGKLFAVLTWRRWVQMTELSNTALRAIAKPVVVAPQQPQNLNATTVVTTKPDSKAKSAKRKNGISKPQNTTQPVQRVELPYMPATKNHR